MKRFLTIALLLLSLNGFAQQKIFATISGGDLYSFDITNCTRNFIGSTGQGLGDIAFTPDGQLWGIYLGNLYHIDTATANATLVGNTGIGGVSLVALNDTTLLIEGNFNLYGVNTNTAGSYYIDTIGYQAAGDLTWYDNDLFMVTSGGQIIKIVLNNTSTAILSVTPIGSAIPGCEGAVTASFIGDYNSIVGFNGPNLIKICQLDGSYQPLCPSLNVGGTPGAASIRLPSQKTEPSTCQMPNLVVNSDLREPTFEIYPNPSKNEFTVSSNILFNNAQLEIYDSSGKRIYQQNKITVLNNKISAEQIPSGIYFIRIYDSQKSLSQRLIIE